jgi:Flp pilus assembly secretin CpaC
MRAFSLVVVFLGCSSPVCGQTALPNPQIPPVQAPSPPRAPTDAQAAELLKAAEHLEAAGLKRDADKLRSKAHVARQFIEDREQLARKLDELKILQAEIGRLRAATNTPAAEQVMLHLHVVELNRTTMRELGLAVKEPRAHMLFHVEDGQAFLAGLRQLQQKDLVRILAEPILVTMSGRPAYFNAGGEIPVPAVGDAPFRYVPYGYRWPLGIGPFWQ